jgi:excisionase family DNA binding protein
MANERQTLTITELARILGISRTTCYQLARRKELPVRVIRVGRRLIVSKAELARFLGGIEASVHLGPRHASVELPGRVDVQNH